MRPALLRRTDGHALFASTRAAASFVAVLLAGFAAGGCAAKGHGEMTLQSAKRDAEFVNRTGAAEDLAVVTAIQRGIASGANEHFTFGRFEGAIAHFHRTLAAALS